VGECARLEECLDRVEGVHGDGGGAYRRRTGGRVAREHAVPQRLAASHHRGGLQGWNTPSPKNGEQRRARNLGEDRKREAAGEFGGPLRETCPPRALASGPQSSVAQ